MTERFRNLFNERSIPTLAYNKSGDDDSAQIDEAGSIFDTAFNNGLEDPEHTEEDDTPSIEQDIEELGLADRYDDPSFSNPEKDEVLPPIEFDDIDTTQEPPASTFVPSTTGPKFVAPTEPAFAYRRHMDDFLIDDSEPLEHERIRTSTITSPSDSRYAQ